MKIVDETLAGAHTGSLVNKKIININNREFNK